MLYYTFDQRNLMISHSLSDGGVDPQLQATFTYDAAGNRIQQTDYSGSFPVTTTYTNDVIGLAQVLVADDGTTEVYNLWGLRLLSQDDGQTLRLPLTDGLGSVRVEMVADVVESTTTYDPYGNLLARIGDSGTAYGFTGEQHDETTGLLYLRARYYNPALRSFMGKDAWDGDMGRPQSMNGWSYVENNPVNLTDPTGNNPFRAEYCKTSKASYQYLDCVLSEYRLKWDLDIELASFDYQGEPGCWYGPVPYRYRGYTEGTSFTYTGIIGYTSGYETVYDFATMERQVFRYDGGGLTYPNNPPQ